MAFGRGIRSSRAREPGRAIQHRDISRCLAQRKRDRWDEPLRAARFCA